MYFMHVVDSTVKINIEIVHVQSSLSTGTTSSSNYIITLY